MNARRADRGLTLIEVVLAVTILSIGLVGLIGAAARALSVVRVATNYAAAQDLFERVRLEYPVTFEDGETDAATAGGFDAPFDDWHWSRTIEPFTAREGETLFRVATRIHWSERGRDGHEEYVELVFAPAAARARTPGGGGEPEP